MVEPMRRSRTNLPSRGETVPSDPLRLDAAAGLGSPDGLMTAARSDGLLVRDRDLHAITRPQTNLPWVTAGGARNGVPW
jgi:hypothetical protein